MKRKKQTRKLTQKRQRAAKRNSQRRKATAREKEALRHQGQPASELRAAEQARLADVQALEEKDNKRLLAKVREQVTGLEEGPPPGQLVEDPGLDFPASKQEAYARMEQANRERPMNPESFTEDLDGKPVDAETQAQIETAMQNMQNTPVKLLTSAELAELPDDAVVEVKTNVKEFPNAGKRMDAALKEVNNGQAQQ